MQRLMGLGPVLVLSLAALISAVIGLNLSHDSSRPLRVADELGCQVLTRGISETGVSQETCSYNGDRIIIWTLSRGSNVVYPLAWVENGVAGPTWIVGCGKAEDCVAIRGRLGGQLLGPGWLATSIELR